MSNILTKMVKKGKLLSVIAAIVLAAAIAVGVVCGLNGWGVFNKDALLKDSKTLTVSMSQFVYQSEEHLEILEDACDEALSDVKVSHQLKSQMSGDTCEIVYVFASDVDLTPTKAALEEKASELTAKGAKLDGFSVSVASNSEAAIGVLAKHYILRGVIAGVVLSVLVFAYVAIRYSLYMGITATVSTVLGMLLTVSLFIFTRIPVTASVIYVIAVSALLSAVMSLITLNKLRANAKAAEGQTAEELVVSSLAIKEIVLLTALMGGALVIVGAVATAGVRWFALLSLIALLVSACVGLVYTPALYLPLQVKADNKPVEGAYVGAEKTSTKAKKVFENKKAIEEVKAEPAEEPAPEVVEETTEEVVEEREEVEEPVEETPAEEPVEETVQAEEAEEKQD